MHLTSFPKAETESLSEKSFEVILDARSTFLTRRRAEKDDIGRGEHLNVLGQVWFVQDRQRLEASKLFSSTANRTFILSILPETLMAKEELYTITKFIIN